MAPSWLRPLFKKRPVGRSSVAPFRLRLGMEALEDRALLTATWTGNAVLSSGDFSWGNGANWDVGRAPLFGEDVVFPAGLDADHKPPSALVGGAFVFPNNADGANSTLDQDYTIGSLTIQDDNYHIDASLMAGGATLTIQGDVITNIADAPTSLQGISLLGTQTGASRLSVSLSSGIHTFQATGPGLLYVTAPIGQTVTSGIDKTGTGSLALAGNNTFTGAVTVTQGVLIAASDNALGTTAQSTAVSSGATLAVVGGATVAEPLSITGNGADTDNDGVPDGALQTFVNPFATFTNGLLGNPGAGSTVTGGITLITSASVGVEGADSLTISTGAITGTFSVTKLGTGVLNLSGANTYTGQTLVTEGTLQVANNAALSTSGNAGNGTIVSAGAMLELLGVRNISEALFLSGGGLLDSAGREQGALRQADANLSTLTGPITLQGSPTSIGAVTGGQLTLNGQLGGSVAFSKVGTGIIRIPVANAGFTGDVFVRNGTLQMANVLALGPTTGPGVGSVTVTSTAGAAAATGTLQIEGTFSLGKTLTLNGSGAAGAGALHIVIPSGGGTSTVTVPMGIVLGSAATVTTDTGTVLDVTGVVSGAGNLTKDGDGALLLEGNNTYTGDTVLLRGRTGIFTNTALGAANSGSTTVTAGATLEVNNSLTVVGEQLNIAGIGAGGAGALVVNSGVSTWTGAVNVTGARVDFNALAGASLAFANAISGAADVHKLGAGALRFTGTAANTYTGGTFVDLGELLLGKTNGVNAVGGQVFVGVTAGAGNNSARLTLLGSEQIPEVVGVTPVTVTVNETGLFDLNGSTETVGPLLLTGGEVVTGAGRLRLGSNVTTNASAESSIIGGTISFANTARIFTVADGAAAADLQLGSVSEATGIIKNGPGVLRVTGAGVYTGATQISAGTLQLGANNVLPDGTTVVIATGATFDASTFKDTVATLSGAGTLALGTGNVTIGGDNAPVAFTGPITSAAGGGLTKVGTGTLTLGTDSLGYLGTTTVSGGTVLVNADLSASAVAVNANSTLSGTGRVGAVTVNAGGKLAPGTSPGILRSAGNLTLNAGSSFVVELNGTTVGTDYDQFTTTGTVTINGATLSLNLGYPAAVGALFNIIAIPNGVADPGRFAGLADMATFVQDGRVFQIRYTPTGVTLEVLKFASTAGLTADNNPALPNTPVTYTFTLAPGRAGDARATGTVQFFNNGAPLGTPVTLTGAATGTATATLTVDGTVIPFLTPGPHTITVQYAGDANYQANNSATLPQSVTVVSSTTLSAQQGTVPFGTATSFLAGVVAVPGLPAPSGTFTFVNAGTGAVLGVVALDATGRAVFTGTFPAGTTSVRADYSGDGFYRASSSTVVAQEVVEQNRFVVGSDAGPIATVQVYDPRTGALLNEFRPFDLYTGGVKVATGDVNGDGIADIVVSAGAGAPGGHVKVYSGADYSLIASFLTFPGYTGGVNIAAGDVDGDGFADVVVGTAIANDHVKVFSGRALLATGSADASTIMSFFAYGGGNPVGVTVGTGDVDGDGRADVITGSALSAGHVKVFQAQTGLLIGSYLAYGAGYLGGIFVAGGDINGDGRAEIITGATSAPHVKALTQSGQELASFLAYQGSPFGVRVGTVDRNGDGLADILTGSAGGAPAVKVFNGLNTADVLESFLSQPGLTSGVFVGGSTK